MKEKIATLRNWCRTRARPASVPYATEQEQTGRAIDMDTTGKSA
jgi:hypothetical protein